MHIVFTVLDHTKFGPEIVSRAIVGYLNRANTLKPSTLLNFAEYYSSAQTYDASSLYEGNSCTSLIFKIVEEIMSYRHFLIVADDGAFNPVLEVGFSVGLALFAGRISLFSEISAVAGAVESLAARSL